MQDAVVFLDRKVFLSSSFLLKTGNAQLTFAEKSGVAIYAGRAGGGNVMFVCLYQKSASVIRNRIVVLSVYTVQKILGICTV